jgi:cyclic beta-1,2-glucan synthetase
MYEAMLAGTHDELAARDQDQTILEHAAEWLLDNYYIVQQALRQIRQDMPQGYYRRLPKLGGGELAGYPRVYAIARQLTEMDRARLDLNHVLEFVAAYQEVVSLTMGEIWALPTMLRLCSIEVLARAFAPSSEQPLPEDAAAPVTATPDEPLDTVAGNCILSLRALAEEDWDAFFETLSLVERALRRDPAGVYAAMDFETRDRYRQTIEALAVAAGHDEQAIIEEVLRLAGSAEDGDGRLRPVATSDTI